MYSGKIFDKLKYKAFHASGSSTYGFSTIYYFAP